MYVDLLPGDEILDGSVIKAQIEYPEPMLIVCLGIIIYTPLKVMTSSSKNTVVLSATTSASSPTRAQQIEFSTSSHLKHPLLDPYLGMRPMARA